MSHDVSKFCACLKSKTDLTSITYSAPAVMHRARSLWSVKVPPDWHCCTRAQDGEVGGCITYWRGTGGLCPVQHLAHVPARLLKGKRGHLSLRVPYLPVSQESRLSLSIWESHWPSLCCSLLQGLGVGGRRWGAALPRYTEQGCLWVAEATGQALAPPPAHASSHLCPHSDT